MEYINVDQAIRIMPIGHWLIMRSNRAYYRGEIERAYSKNERIIVCVVEFFTFDLSGKNGKWVKCIQSSASAVTRPVNRTIFFINDVGHCEFKSTDQYADDEIGEIVPPNHQLVLETKGIDKSGKLLEKGSVYWPHQRDLPPDIQVLLNKVAKKKKAEVMAN